MRTKIKPDIDPDKLKVNPFVYSPGFLIPVREFKENSEVVSIKDIQEGIVTNTPLTLSINKVVEQEQYTKVFTRSGYRLHIMSLSSRAKDLYLWITYEVERDQDWMWINSDRYMKETGVSVNTYKGAIEDLTSGGVITPTLYNSTYWINPLFFFSGNRIKKYSDKLTIVV